MKINGITERIVAQADEELKRRIEQDAKPMDALLRNGCSYNVNCGDDDKPIEVNWHRALNALKKKAFELHAEANRQKAIDNFMQRVERLGDEIDNLRSNL